MAIIYVIRIKDAISQSLTSSEQVLSFFQQVISEVIVDTIVIDFSGIIFMSSSSAKQYVICKNESNTKKIREINLRDEINNLIMSSIQGIEISN